MHIKEKVISTEKALVVLGICTVAIMLPSPTICYDGVTEVDCLNNLRIAIEKMYGWVCLSRGNGYVV